MKLSTSAPLLAVATLCLTTSLARPVTAAAAKPKNLTKNPIGYCTMDVEKAKKAGFDYAELAFRQFAAMPDEEFAKFLAKHKEVGLPTPVANVFLPNDIKVVGPDVDDAKVVEYAKKGFDRAKQLGIKIVVFGSGGARKVPDGFAKDEAQKQLVAIAKKLAPEAKKRGVTLAVEPLQSKETNIINTAGEGLEWVKAVNHPNFQLMVDFYHLALEKEDPAILVKAAKQIKHIHIANPRGRVFPQSSDEYDYSGFFENLRKSGYQGGISVEAKPAKDFDAEAPTAIALLRQASSEGVKPPTHPVPEAVAPTPPTPPKPPVAPVAPTPPGSAAPAAPSAK